MAIWQETQPPRDPQEWIEPRAPLADSLLQKLGGDRREAMRSDPKTARIWDSALVDAATAGNAPMARVLLQGGADPFWKPVSGPRAFEAAWTVSDPAVAEEMCRFGPFEQARDPALLERAAQKAPFVAQEMTRWGGAQPTPRALLHAVAQGADRLAEDLIGAGADAPAASRLARQDAQAAGAALSASIQQALARWESKALAEAAPAAGKPRVRRPGL